MAPVWDSTSEERLTGLDCRCPYCAAPTEVRIPESYRDHMRSTPSHEQIGTYKCGRCSEVYPITAGAYQRAD